MALILTDHNKVGFFPPCKNTRTLVGFPVIACKVTVMLSVFPGIFFHLFIIRSSNCYKIARIVITALHIKDGFNYVYNIYVNAR